jgi:hypothetical protein
MLDDPIKLGTNRERHAARSLEGSGVDSFFFFLVLGSLVLQEAAVLFYF